MTGEWLLPWRPIDGEDERRGLFAELQREVDSTHALWGIAVTAVARRPDNDDVLFSLPDGRAAVVHLTWTGRRDRSPFPWTEFHATTEAFVQDRMIPDHRGWAERGAP